MEQQLAIMQLILFFFTLPFMFKALMAIEIPKAFKKNHIWQIQFIYIVLTVILSYYFVDAMMGLARLSLQMM